MDNIGTTVGVGIDSTLAPLAAFETFVEELTSALAQQDIRFEAGFDDVQVVRRDLEAFARQSGVPEEDLVLFRGSDTPFLHAR